MKVAVCISGQMRSYKMCAAGLISNVIRDADVFVSTWSNQGKRSDHHSMFPKGSHSADDIVTEDDIMHTYPNVKGIQIEEWKDKYEYKIENVEAPSRDFAYSMIAVYYKIMKCHQMMRSFAKDYGDYDCIIKLRPDMIAPPIDYALKDLNSLWHYPNGLGIRVSDRIALGSPKLMDYYADCFNHLTKYWSEATHVDTDLGRRSLGLSEIMMKYHLDKKGITPKTLPSAREYDDMPPMKTQEDVDWAFSINRNV